MTTGHSGFPPKLHRRTLLAGAMAAGGVALGAGDAAAVGLWARGRQQRPDAFDAALAYVRGVHPGQTWSYTGRCPDGSPLQVRVATPVAPPRTVPVVLFAGSSDVPAGLYDPLLTLLAGRGYLVLAPQFTPVRGASTDSERWRRIAEFRFACDSIFAIRAALGPSAERMEPNLIAACGHGDGSCVALQMVGFDSQFAPQSTFADGRFRAAVALEPHGGFEVGGMGQVGQAYAQVSGAGLIVSAPDRLPRPPQGSGLLGLAVTGLDRDLGLRQPQQGPSGLLAAQTSLAATAAFFDWHLRGDGAAGQSVSGLNGRVVEGLEQPLVLLRA